MDNNEHNLIELVGLLDQVIIKSRLNMIEQMLRTEPKDRLVRLACIVKSLPPGGYLLGTGPTATNIIPLTVQEIVIGRVATPLEKLSDQVVDYNVHDTAYFCPNEVSRVHVKIMCDRRKNPGRYFIQDMGSQCGVYVNGKKLDPDVSHALKTADLISLGPSHVSTYIMLIKEEAESI
jgi:pSer/pThr/pTyr-binding forkhead associated (FHA) protein